MTIQMISNGSYSDYRIIAIVEGDGDVGELFKTFRKMIPKYPYFIQGQSPQQRKENIISWRESVKRNLGELAVFTESCCFNESYSFIKFLVRDHGFKSHEYDEVNLEDVACSEE